jgi:hypothetical protein
MSQVINSVTFKNRFARFIDAPDARVEFAIEEAALFVDASWGQYQALGLLYRAAHILMVELMRAASGTGQEVASESFAGVLSVTYKTTPTATEGSMDDLETTQYGLRFKELYSLVFPAVAIV